MRVDVLYIHPTKSSNSNQYSIMPVGIFLLINLLIRNNYSVSGINVGIEKSLDTNYDLADELKSTEYKILLIDLHWYVHSFGAIEIAELSKSLY